MENFLASELSGALTLLVIGLSVMLGTSWAILGFPRPAAFRTKKAKKGAGATKRLVVLVTALCFSGHCGQALAAAGLYPAQTRAAMVFTSGGDLQKMDAVVNYAGQKCAADLEAKWDRPSRATVRLHKLVCNGREIKGIKGGYIVAKDGFSGIPLRCTVAELRGKDSVCIDSVASGTTFHLAIIN